MTNALLLAITVTSAPMHADPLTNQPCNESGYDKSFQDMLIKTSVIGEDNRAPLTVQGPSLGLSPAEIKQIRQTTGFVFCPGTQIGHVTISSASLAGSTGQIIMAAHALMDDNGNYVEPLDQCYFQNQDIPYTKLFLNLEKGGGPGLKMGSSYPGEDTSDYAVVKLKVPKTGNPFAKFKPIPLDLSETKLHQGDTMVTVSATQKGMPKDKFDRNQPIVQGCAIGDTLDRAETVILGHCDAKEGASGGPQFVRNSNGQLVLKAIVVGGGAGKDGEDYNLAERRYSYSLAIDGQILKDIRSMDPAISENHGGVFNDKSL